MMMMMAACIHDVDGNIVGVTVVCVCVWCSMAVGWVFMSSYHICTQKRRVRSSFMIVSDV